MQPLWMNKASLLKHYTHSYSKVKVRVKLSALNNIKLFRVSHLLSEPLMCIFKAPLYVRVMLVGHYHWFSRQLPCARPLLSRLQ